VGKPEGKRPLERPRCRWVDNIKKDLREIGWEGMDWIDLAQDGDQWRALVSCTLNVGDFVGCKGSDDDVYHSELLGFRTCPSSGILEARKLSVSETEAETDPVSETLFFLASRIPDDGQRPKIR
jgi:hypothetical protein